MLTTYGEFSGGHLCFYELGLVFDLPPGSVAIFDSKRLTHFNCHFEGIRNSLVFHTDQQLGTWAKFGNHYDVDYPLVSDDA